MADQINVSNAVESISRTEDSPFADEFSLSAVRFRDLVLDYNDPEIDTTFIPEHLEADQVEDWLLGLAVRNTLDEQKRLHTFLGRLGSNEVTNG